MHPIERLRYVARVGRVPDRHLVIESVPALASFARDANALLVAIRQLISRQPESPGLMALGAHMVQALDPIEAAYAFSEGFERDMAETLAGDLAHDERGGTDVIDTIASGPGEFLCAAGTAAWIQHAKQEGRSVVAVTPFGSRLPRGLWKAFVVRNLDDESRTLELIGADEFDDLVGPDGVVPVSRWTADCPEAPEIARM